MPGSTIGTHEDLLRQIAENGTIPPERSWADDVLPIFVQVVQEALNDALEAFRENQKDAASTGASAPPPTTTASYENSEDSFQSENAYLLDQLKMCIRGPPFTLQRLSEILLGQEQPVYRTARGGTMLRGDLLQSAIRKCVLVSALE
jgi:hypothetical protein